MACVLTPMVMSGQSYYDDDIYYNPSKVKKTETPEVVRPQNVETAEFDAPTYQVYTTSPRDIDEYNRRNARLSPSDSIPSDSIASTYNPDMFQYTERMERFDNPTLVVSSNDSRLKELYYTDNVNIYVGTPSVTWSFGGFYDPWYSPYRPSWYWGSWDWSWGWSACRPYYGWYDPFWEPSYGYYGWGYSWGYPHHHYHPYYAGPGYYHRDYTDGGRRSFGSSHYPSGRRPELSGGDRYRGSDSYRSTGRRPSSTLYSPSTTNRPSYSRPGSTTTYDGYRGGGTTTYRPSQSTTVRRPSMSTDNRSTYSSPSRTTPSYRQPSTSSPSRSTGGFRGGSTSGGSRGSFSGGSRGGRR